MRKVGILAPLKSPGIRRTLDSLGEVLDVRFEERTFAFDASIDAWFLDEADPQVLCRIAKDVRPSYAVISRDLLVPCGESSTMEFSRHSALPAVLSGRRIRTDEIVQLMALPIPFHGDTPIASKAGFPVWALQESCGVQHHYVSCRVPDLNEADCLFQQFNGRRFLHLLPLIVFLRSLNEDQCWEHPPLQACFMFDDPNLHWRTYGFLKFSEIAAHAQVYDYHTCFATIPLDTWLVHKPTALLFQEHRDRLSLLIHGNNHIAQELARPQFDQEQNRNLRQALGRIDRFERRSGVEVSRVMAPPHGACSESTLGQMAGLDFEAATISSGSLCHYNEHAAWIRTLGMKPSDIIAGLPVFPRFPFSGDCHNSALIAALLHQPIIAMGHHRDIADGLHQLAFLSGFVNSLGAVRWSNLERIARAHYAQRVDGNTLQVRMFTRRIEVPVPAGITHISVERKWLRGAASMPLAWKPRNHCSDWELHPPSEPISVLPFQEIEIVAEPPSSQAIHAKTTSKNFPLWPVLRRQLTEMRDRLAPVFKSCSIFPIKPKEKNNA